MGLQLVFLKINQQFRFFKIQNFSDFLKYKVFQILNDGTKLKKKKIKTLWGPSHKVCDLFGEEEPPGDEMKGQ